METRIASPRQQLNEWRRLRAWTLHQAGWTGSAIAQALGVTPILRAPLTRDHWSVIGGLTAEERLLLQMQEQAFRGPGVVRFLQHLLRQIPGQLLVSWDGAPIHRAQVVTEFLAAGAAERLHLEPLPGYAPALNTAAGVGNHLKPVE